MSHDLIRSCDIMEKLFLSRVFYQLLVDSLLVKISSLVHCTQFIISNTEECRTICYHWSLDGHISVEMYNIPLNVQIRVIMSNNKC